jgi:hypothetical protein
MRRFSRNDVANNIGSSATQLRRIGFLELEAVEVRGPAVGDEQARRYGCDRRLARAGRAGDHDDRARGNLHTEVVDHAAQPEVDPDAA